VVFKLFQFGLQAASGNTTIAQIQEYVIVTDKRVELYVQININFDGLHGLNSKTW